MNAESLIVRDEVRYAGQAMDEISRIDLATVDVLLGEDGYFRRRGRYVRIGPTALRLGRCLAEAHGRLVPHYQLGGLTQGGDHRWHMAMLTRALGDAVRCHRGEGYSLRIANDLLLG